MVKFPEIEYSLLGKMILYFLRIKGLLIRTKSGKYKIFSRTTMKLKELDEKYHKFKNVLKERNIRFTDIILSNISILYGIVLFLL